MSKKCNSSPVSAVQPAELRSADLALPEQLPNWVPAAVRVYLAHTEQGRSLRDIARAEGVHASTVLRQVRRFENRRDDPLIEHALGRMRQEAHGPGAGRPVTPCRPRPLAAGTGAVSGPMSAPTDQPVPGDGDGVAAMPAPPADEARLRKAAAEFLPLLAGDDRLMAVAADMDKAVIISEGAAGTSRLAVLDRVLAEAFALHGWISCRKTGRVAQYVLAPEGRSWLRQNGEGRREADAAAEAEGRFRPPAESPVSILARRRDRDGQPFLTPEQVTAATRLHEDFEIAQMGERVTMDWARMALCGAGRMPSGRPAAPPRAMPAAARARVEAALAELGPGLGDIALRCCCWQEGVETAEQKLGWSARSGKIVLRIALDRLARHYADLGEAGKLIG